eukprot:snap_masked-scaffold_10-processed-gene-8.36-mRNA-1 protein AED:1.00 eAED:1.00 QI:0/-1/0/0/-1/1/1/0/297
MNIRKIVQNIVSGTAGVETEGFLIFEANIAMILFLDNCREENNLMTLKEFEDRARSCGFEEAEVEEMLELYSKSGVLCYFPRLNLEANENFIFFAPSYLAQALGNFIRDPSFHELAFRVPSEKFSLYRKYVDTGKISKEMFNILLKKYTKEKKNVIQLAIETLVLIPVENENDIYILPELLPSIIPPRIKHSSKTDIEFIFNKPLKLPIFVKAITILQKEDNISECFIYKYFARFIFENTKIIDIFVRSEKSIGITLVEQGTLSWLKEVVSRVSFDLVNVDNSFDLVQAHMDFTEES